MAEARWRVRLAHAARRDYVAIVRWTIVAFGSRQARAYRVTLDAALASLLENGPNVAGSLARDEIGLGMRTLHVARGGRRGRHFIVYRCLDNETIEVVRILHDAMELERHVSRDPDSA